MHKFEDHFFLISPLLVNLNPTLKDKVSVVAAQCPAMLQVHLLLNIFACNGLKSEVKLSVIRHSMNKFGKESMSLTHLSQS